MAYTIDERDLERQQVLAQRLDPLSIPVLSRVPREGVRKVLDLGCGQGNTSRLLAAQFPGAEVTGIEYDASLVSHARTQSKNPRVRFEQGDAAKLPFPEESFDLVFTRYLLVHVPEPDHVIGEMFRVLRPGGRAVSYEPDCCMDFAYPENPGMRTITRLFQGLFAQPHVGRQLVHRFRRRKPASLEAGACLGMEHEGNAYKRLYRLTAEAMGPAAGAKALLAEHEFQALIAHMKALESSDESVTVKLPDFWVIATR
jgi:SAM-dependent methyltransferase